VVQTNELFPRLLGGGPHVGVGVGTLVQPWQRLCETPAGPLARTPRLQIWRCTPPSCPRASSAVPHMSALGSPPSSSHGSGSGNGRPNVSPKYPASTLATCLTSPSRLVPVGTIGRRASYSESPSSFHTSASRAACR